MSTDLTLPGAISQTALDLPKGLSFEEWEETGKTLGKIGRACQWWIGDWLNYGEREYGETYAQAMDETGLEYGTVANYAYVAKAVEPSRRRESLSFSHHSEVASMEPEEQEAWLERARYDEWPVAKLRAKIKKERAGAEGGDEPERCPTCGQTIRKKDEA